MFVVQGSAQPSPLSPGGGRLVPPRPPAGSQATPCLRSCSRGPDPGSTAWPPSPEHRAQQVGLLCPQQQQGPPACHSPGGGARGPQILFTDEKTEAQSSEGAAEGSRPQRARGAAGRAVSGVTGSGSQGRKGVGMAEGPVCAEPQAYRTQDPGRKGSKEPKLPCEAKPWPKVFSFWSGKVSEPGLSGGLPGGGG